MKKVVIVDDEQAGIRLIEEYLISYKDLIVVGKANNGVDAIQVINTFKPDLVFMDIQMPGLNGFDVIEHLEELPQIIFSTAYDQYALRAFDVHALDYLLKPYTKERFDVAINKTSDQSVKQLIPLAESHFALKNDFPKRLIVQKGEKYVTLATQDIYFIEAYGDYSKIHTSQQSFLSSHGISKLEERLHPKEFLRVHRSSIISLSAIKEINKYGRTFILILKNDAKVRVGRTYAEKIKSLII